MDLKFVELKTPIKVTLKDFILNGKFDCLKLGVSKSWLQFNFAEPDDILAGETFKTSPIWRYGNLELHFKDDLLHFIFSDYVEDLFGGEKVNIDKWILRNRQQTKMVEWIVELNRNVKNFRVVHLPELEQSSLIIEQDDKTVFKLRFISPECYLESSERKNPTEYILGSICLCPKELETF